MDIQSSEKKTITGTFHLNPLIAGLLFVIDMYLNGKVGLRFVHNYIIRLQNKSVVIMKYL